MPYLNLQPSSEAVKETISNLRLASSVPKDCEVYIFYIPGIIVYPELQKILTRWGKTTGKNAFVGLLSSDAPDYKTIIKYFKITKSPAVVISAKPAFATDDELENPITAFARIDNKRVISNKDEIVECIQEVYNLFMRKQVINAVLAVKREGFKQTLSYYLGNLKDQTNRSLSEFFNNHEIAFDVFRGKIVIQPLV